MVEKVYLVPDISCAHCVKAISDELNAIAGVQVMDVSIESKRVVVQHDESVTEDEIVTGIEDAGYSVAASTG